MCVFISYTSVILSSFIAINSHVIDFKDATYTLTERACAGIDDLYRMQEMAHPQFPSIAGAVNVAEYLHPVVISRKAGFPWQSQLFTAIGGLHSLTIGTVRWNCLTSATSLWPRRTVSWLSLMQTKNFVLEGGGEH